jgi:hypothetical protein
MTSGSWNGDLVANVVGLGTKIFYLKLRAKKTTRIISGSILSPAANSS